jgi:lysophospholipase L1-like esterase
MDPRPFLRGVAFPAAGPVPYPRAKPDPRLPRDTWEQAKIPVGVRLELVGDEVEIAYRTQTDDLGYRGDGAGRTFEVWRGGERVDEEKAELGEDTMKLALGTGRDAAIVYLPEGMRPEILGLTGDVEPAPSQPRWVVYGDSVAEGWIASAPAMAWPAIAGRERALDVINMGYAGAARGEIPSAEQVAELDADAITIAYGTNCWIRTAHSVGMAREGMAAFLEIVREKHPETPIVVSSPIARPDAELTPNPLGATVEHIRDALEAAVRDWISAGDVNLELVPGRHLVHESQLGDGIHPNDEGHRALAEAIGTVVAARLG